MNAAKGPWIHRFLISFFTVIFAILVFWVLGFLVEDIESIQGPRYPEIESRYVDKALVDRNTELRTDIEKIDRDIANKHEEMRVLSDSSRNLQHTINQLLELQKLATQKTIPLSKGEQANLSESLSHFLQNQKQYQTLNNALSLLTERKQYLVSEKETIKKQMEDQRRPAREKYNYLRESHNLRLAVYQLLILLPLLAVGVFMALKKRGSLYFPIYLGFGAATLVKVTLVIHRYFPSRYVKYILIGGMLIVVVKLLVHFIKSVSFPKTELLLKQYREGYERFFCPVCGFPIRRGPRKYLFWTRRSVGKTALPREITEDAPYTCPSCGTVLFEECSECHNIRHSLLPYCNNCNAEKEIFPEN